MRKLLLRTLCFAASIAGMWAASAGVARAQAIALYNFTSTLGTYTPITGGTSLTASNTAALDDQNFAAVTLPFTFTYHGAPFTSVGIDANGYLKMGATSSTSYTALSTYTDVIGGLAEDFYSLGTTTGRDISYVTTGTSPNRVFIVQWTNWGFWSSGLADFNFQIKLFETSNVVEFVYGGFPFVSSTSQATQTPQVGLTGATLTDFKMLTSTTSWVTPTLATTNTSATNMTLSSTVKPDSGRTYTFTPPPPCTGTPVAGTTTASPAGVCSGNPVTISVPSQTTSGITYQLLTSSTVGGPYTAVGTAQGSALFTANPTTPTYYRVRVLCTSGSADTSSAILVNINGSFPGGTYTINNASPTAGSNYNSFTDAVAAISCGITGPVIFNVANNATPYTEQINIPNIPTTSATNTVTFNGNDAAISFNAPTTLPAVISLNGADWIRLRRLRISNQNSTSGVGVLLTNNADNNIVDSCTIALDSNSTGFPPVGVAISGSLTSPTTSGSNCDTNTISNNTIIGGYYGMTIYGGTTAATASQSNTISNNVLKNFYLYGIYMAYVGNTLVERNDISRPTRTNLSTFYGIYHQSTTGAGTNVRISRNRIHDPAAAVPSYSMTAYGIYSTATDATAAAPHVISNNLIYNMRFDGGLYGFYNSSSDHVKYYHNTVSADDATSTTVGLTRGFYQITSAVGLELKNNIFSLTRGGTGIKYAIYFGTTIGTANPYSARSNVYHVTNPGTGGVAYYNATTYPTLAAYQAVSLQDTGSVETNPVFVSVANGNFLPTNASINNIGVPTSVLVDLNGAPRSTTTPDPGAIEFTPVACTTPPIGGMVISSDTVICSGTTVSFDLSGNSFGLGQTYVWQSAPAMAGPYTPVSTSSSLTNYSQAVASTTYFRAAVTCGTSTTFSDTQLVTVLAPLAAGTYTINAGAPATATNFQSFAVAAQRMQCGVAGPIVINVTAGSGPYNNDQFLLGTGVTGTSATNTITVNGNGNVMNFTATNSNQRGAIMLNSVDYVTVNNLVVNVNTTAATYGFGVHLINDADNNTISGCTINIDSNATSSLFAGMVISGSFTGATGTGTGLCDSNRFLNNAVNGGYYGMTCVGNSAAAPNYNNLFRGNTVRNPYVYGIYGYYTNGWMIDSNYVTRPSRPLITTFYGVGLSTLSIGTTVSRNRIFNTAGANTTSYTAYPLYTTGADATAAQPNLFVNNLVYDINGNASIYGIYNSSSDFCLYRHNTFSLDDTTYTGGNLTYGAYQITLATGLDYRNNIFSLRRTGSGVKTALYFSTATSTFTSNFNVFNVNGGTGTSAIGYYNATSYATLAAWQSNAGKDTASVDLDPMFANVVNGNLTPTNQLVDNIGTPVGVLVDAFGASRSLTVPDIGAIEWTWIPPCNVPTALNDAAAATTATIDWTPSSSTNVGYEYTLGSVTTTPTGAGTPVSLPPVSFSGLTPSTTYYWFVRTVCGPTSYSGWVMDSFTTCTPPPATLSAAGSSTPTTAIAICQGDTAQLRAPGGTGNTYLFLLNGVVTGTGAGPDSVLRTTQPGTYRVVVTNATGCYDTSAAAGLTVTVNPLPVPVVTQTDYNVLSTGSFSTYQWNLGGTPVVGATSQTYTAPFTGNGMYTVTVTDANGCRGTSSSFNLTTASVGGAAGVVASVRIFPNPTTGRVSIESAVAVRAQVWTVDGRRLLEVDNATSVDLSALAPGVYTLRLTNAEGIIVATEKVTKTN